MTVGSYLWSFLYVLHTYLFLGIQCQEKKLEGIFFSLRYVIWDSLLLFCGSLHTVNEVHVCFIPIHFVLIWLWFSEMNFTDGASAISLGIVQVTHLRTFIIGGFSLCEWVYLHFVISSLKALVGGQLKNISLYQFAKPPRSFFTWPGIADFIC